MARPKRSKYQKERDRRILSQWMAMGKMDTMSQVEVADQLREVTNSDYTLSQQQISYDITLIKKRWEKEQIKNVQKAKMRESKKLDGIEREYLVGWERSKREKEKHKRKVKNEEGERSKEVQVETEERVGDPRFLDGIVRVAKRRAKLWGYDAAQDMNIRSIDMSELTDRQLQRLADGEPIEVVLATSGTGGS